MEIELPKIDHPTTKIVGVGIDLVQNGRIRRLLDKFGDRFLYRCFTRGEIAYCMRKPLPEQPLSARFAAKEAAYKALNGRPGLGLKWKECEVINPPGKPPEIVLHGNAKAQAEKLEVNQIFVSLTHEADWSAAVVVLTS